MTETTLHLVHDLKSPLLTVKEVISRYADILPKKDFEILMKATARAYEICNEGLKNSKQKTGKVLPLKKICNISKSIEEVIQEYQLRGLKPNQSLELTTNNSALAIKVVNSTEFKRMITNLIDNSLRAIGESGRVQIEVSEENGRATVKVIDNGTGISKQQLNRLGQFGVSFSNGGHGYGLWGIKKVLKMKGGSLAIKSTVGLGTIVSLSLPIAKVDSKTPNFQQAKRVVLLDDDQLLHYTTDLLLNSKGFNGERVFFKSTKQFGRYLSKLSAIEKQNTIFMIDCHLKNEGQRGEDIIYENNLMDRAVLFSGDSRALEYANAIGLHTLAK